MSKIEYTGWIGRDNWIGFTLRKGNPVANLTESEMITISNYGFRYQGVEYNTVTNPSQCRITEEIALIEFQVGQIISVAGVDSKCELLVYTSLAPAGVVWGDYFVLTMKDDALD